MRTMQMSFTAGEISPILHARVDLAKYSTALAELKNMIVLPQGGVTRRGGFNYIEVTAGNTGDIKLIPFEYSSGDSLLIEFGNHQARVWGSQTGSTMLATFSTPYSSDDVKQLRYIQSGNVMFLAHRKYRPQMLTRQSNSEWTLKDFEFKGGPFIEGSEYLPDVKLKITPAGGNQVYVTAMKNGKDIDAFTPLMIDALLKLEYPMPPSFEEFMSGASPSYALSGTVEVKGTMNVMTSGDWTGTITIERSVNNGGSWMSIRQYDRTDTSTQGQWDFTISETEDYVLYRVKAEHTSEKPATVKVSVSGFLRSAVYKVLMSTYSQITAESQDGRLTGDGYSGTASFWAIGAWGDHIGYPGAVAMYQDRLVFAGSTYQPQTIWFSRTGDYASFAVSDPLRDDDAINITLSASNADGVHSLLACNDLLAFTASGEWKIKGSGDYGAITPSALTAHEQTNIGTKNIQPILANGRVIIVQAQGQKVYALGYDLNVDGYTGSEISILSEHLFQNRPIADITYQQTPDSLLCFSLATEDNEAVFCTYNPEHEVIGWSRQEIKDAKFISFAAVKKEKRTILYSVVKQSTGDYVLMRMRQRDTESSYRDSLTSFESSLTTLRINVNGEGGALYSAKKLVPRISVSAINTIEAWVAPAFGYDSAKDWERRRRIKWDGGSGVRDANIQLDSGFSINAAVQIRAAEGQPMTIAAILPLVTAGG